MARRKNKKEQQPVGYVVVADGETEQWYVELVKKYYDLKIKFQPELSCHSISKQFNIVRESINEGFEHVFWIIDFDNIQKENKEAKVKNSVLQKFRVLYHKAISDKSWEGKLTLIVNNPSLEYWYYLHQNPNSTKYFAKYENDLLPVLRKFDVGGGLFDRYNKTKHDYLSTPGLFVRLLPYLQKIDFKRLRAFDFQNCQNESVSEMYKLFEALNIDVRSDK